MKVGISLTSNYPDVKDPRQGARWIIERAAASRRAALDSLFVGDQHVSPTPYYQNTPILGRLLAEWGEAPAGRKSLARQRRIDTEAVCQPLAASPANIVPCAAASSR